MTGRTLRTAVRAVPFALWCAATWQLSSQSDPASELGVQIDVPDKLAHWISYFAGGAAAAILVRCFTRRGIVVWTVSLAACTLWGVLDEVHQSFVPLRTCDPWDVAADGLGAASGAAVLQFAAARFRRTRI